MSYAVSEELAEISYDTIIVCKRQFVTKLDYYLKYKVYNGDVISMREEAIKRGSWVAVMIVGQTKTSFLLMVRAIGTKRTSNKFEANNDAATGSFVSSFFHLARSFVLVNNLF